MGPLSGQQVFWDSRHFLHVLELLKLSFRFQNVWRFQSLISPILSVLSSRVAERHVQKCTPFLLLTFLGLVDGRVIGCLDDSLSGLVVCLAAASTEPQLVQSWRYKESLQ